MLGLQHVFVISVGWIFVVVVVKGIDGTPEQAAAVIRVSMSASGIATILQARTKGPVGSGYLCPSSCGPAYIPASILAGKTGGLSLLFGQTILPGAFEAVLSRVMQRLRALFPAHVTGLVVSMVGIELIALGCPKFMGFTAPGLPLDGRAILVALISAGVMVGPSV